MSSKQKRPLGDANEEMDPNKRAKRDGQWAAKEVDSSITSSPGAAQRDPNQITPAAPTARDVWRLGETRRAIFAKIQNLEGQDAVNPQQNAVRENLSRRRVYEEMYAKGYGSGNGAAIIVNIEYSVDARLWTDHGMSFCRLVYCHLLTYYGGSPEPYFGGVPLETARYVSRG